MKKTMLVLAVLLVSAALLFAQEYDPMIEEPGYLEVPGYLAELEGGEAYLLAGDAEDLAALEEGPPEGREIPNLLSAARAANPGDYIILPSGRRYVLTREEIEIANGRFDFSDLSGVHTQTRGDGTLEKSISAAHTAFVFPDGQSAHLLRTAGSFTAFMQQYVERNYFLGQWVDHVGNVHDAMPNGSPRFYVFRAVVRFSTISDGIGNVGMVEVTAFNYKGENFIMRYYSTDEGWSWGHVVGTWFEVGEPHQLIEFNVE